jgi:Ser/Thr protein kinase RdoA (MazF antagonist)
VGRLIGQGRAAEVYDIGDGRVLRRYREISVHASGSLVAKQAAVMRHLRCHGYPVPEVFDAEGADLVMQRLDGVTMLADLRSHPWRVHRHAETMVELHRRLVEVPIAGLAGAADELVRFSPPEALLHLDFHPDNVMLTADGPMVFDWTNAAVGPAAADVAHTWIVVATSTVAGPWWMRSAGQWFRRRFVHHFVDGCGRAAAITLLPAMGEYRLADRNVLPEEAVRVRELIAATRSRV